MLITYAKFESESLDRHANVLLAKYLQNLCAKPLVDMYFEFEYPRGGRLWNALQIALESLRIFRSRRVLRALIRKRQPLLLDGRG